jgi:hypothetical protein
LTNAHERKMILVKWKKHRNVTTTVWSCQMAFHWHELDISC